MADIRIKDLTTTASTTAADDFFAADGATNGTRKLSAYSPTFGGNATVGGTLTVNGTTASVGAGTGSIISKLNGAAGSYKLSIYQSAGVDRWYAGLAAGAESGSDGGAPYSIVALTDAGAVIDNALLITRAAGGSITTPRPVSISATTASTSTSSGALVVGNGTSGGLGVGGNITLGGGVNIAGSASDPLPAGTSGVWTASGSGLRINSAGYTFASLTGTSVSDAKWTLNATTASSSYTSGALVVSGGVGIAGALYSQQNTNGILAGAYFENASTGNAATIRHRLIAGASTCDIEAYSSGHATLANRLRFGTSNGLIEFVPSGVTTLSLSASALESYVKVVSSNPSQANNSAAVYFQSTAGADGTLGPLSFALGSYVSATGASRYGYISVGDAATMRALSLCDNGQGAYGQVLVRSSSASTGTSSGALVVSGGVGVAGAGYFGGTVTIASNFSIASTGFYAGGGTPGAGCFLYSATAGTMLCAQTGSSYDLSLASATGTVILGNPTGTSNLEAAGSIKTAAPSGGTAAAWKLGTVATVSPTSPNRTIEVDIGGTIYYIHAKTTNN
jgi:hypothetical protein